MANWFSYEQRNPCVGQDNGYIQPGQSYPPSNLNTDFVYDTAETSAQLTRSSAKNVRWRPTAKLPAGVWSASPILLPPPVEKQQQSYGGQQVAAPQTTRASVASRSTRATPATDRWAPTPRMPAPNTSRSRAAAPNTTRARALSSSSWGHNGLHVERSELVPHPTRDQEDYDWNEQWDWWEQQQHANDNYDHGYDYRSSTSGNQGPRNTSPSRWYNHNATPALTRGSAPHADTQANRWQARGGAPALTRGSVQFAAPVSTQPTPYDDGYTSYGYCRDVRQ